MKNNFFLLAVFLTALIFNPERVNAQPHNKNNEEVIFSFTTPEGKNIHIAKDSANKYMVFRMYTYLKPDLQFPEILDKGSFRNFTFSSNIENPSIDSAKEDLNLLFFSTGGNEYTVYQLKKADGIVDFGLEVKNLTSGMSQRFKGKLKTKKGNLSYFRTNPDVTRGERILDLRE